MTYSELIDYINEWIVTNGNNEITADVLNPVLRAIADWALLNIGDLDDLSTTDKTNLVNAINEVNQAVSDITINVPNVYSGIDDPNITPPPSFQTADFYTQVDLFNQPVDLFIFDGFVWKNVTQNGIGVTQTLAETLAEDNKTNDIPIVSNNGNAVVDVNDDYLLLGYDNGDGSSNITFDGIQTSIQGLILASIYSGAVIQLTAESSMIIDAPAVEINTSILNYNDQEVATQPYADAKVANDLTASTTVAPSKTAVNTALDLKQNIPFEIQVTQSGTSAPVIVTGSLKGNLGATITPSYDSAGVYIFTASLPIFANIKDAYKQPSNTPTSLLSGANFFTLGYFTFVVISDTEAVLSVYYDLFAPGVTADNLITEPLLLELPYN